MLDPKGLLVIDCSAVIGPAIGGDYIDILGIYYFMVGLDWMMAETSSRGGPAKTYKWKMYF